MRVCVGEKNPFVKKVNSLVRFTNLYSLFISLYTSHAVKVTLVLWRLTWKMQDTHTLIVPSKTLQSSNTCDRP
jgi:hypothetical protein